MPGLEENTIHLRFEKLLEDALEAANDATTGEVRDIARTLAEKLKEVARG